jgi:hypothetical protein
LLKEVEDRGFKRLKSRVECKTDGMLFHETPQPFDDVKVRRVSRQEPLFDQGLFFEPVLEELAMVVAGIVTNENKLFSWIVFQQLLIESNSTLV